MNQVISLRILALIKAGKSMEEAINEVLGEGAFQEIAGEVFDALRK